MNGLKHVMIDLETCGVVPGCVGFSIGAVEFLPHERRLGKEFYRVINIESCLDVFLTQDHEPNGTMEWWDKQSDAAKVALLEAQDPTTSVPIAEALEDFNDYLSDVGLATKIRLYGNGADFDNPILRVMYDAAKVKPYLSGRAAFGGRCYRTLKNLHELLGEDFAAPKLARQGTYHNALDDAKSQAMHLMETLAAIGARIGAR